MPISLPFFKLDVNDWLTSQKIEMMELPHIGAYIMLLTKCWRQETCTLPSEELALKKLSKWDDQKHGDFSPVLACFSRLKKTGRVTNIRLYHEWLDAKARTEILSESGQKGAAKRWAIPQPKPSQESKGAVTWSAYVEAYRQRYHVDPVRNQTVNSHLSQLVKRLGADDAPRIAAFYLTHNKSIYVSARHPTNLLLRDAEGLRTEWATGTKATSGEARQAEAQDDARAQINRVRAKLEGRA